MKKYICTVCQWVYDPEVGDPESGIEPGTAFEDIPETGFARFVVWARMISSLTRNKI